MPKDHVEQYVDLFRNALEKGYSFVLCVEGDKKSTMCLANVEGIDQARFLEKFARKARESS